MWIKETIFKPVLNAIVEHIGFKTMVAAAIVLATLSMIFIPLLGIWAVNTLFGTVIAYTFINWLAALVLVSILSGGSSSNK